MRSPIVALCLSTLALARGAPAATETETASVQILSLPPNVFPEVDQIVVASVEARPSRTFGDALARALTGTAPGRSGSTPVLANAAPLTIAVSRANLTSALDASVVRRISAEHGGALVATGAVEGTQESYNSFEESREKVVKTEGGEKKVTVQVPCAERVVRIDYAWTLYGADGAVLLQDSGSDSRHARDCDEGGDDKLAIASVSELTEPAVEGNASAFVRTFRPGYQSVSYPVIETRATTATVAALRGGRWDEAALHTAGALGANPFDHVQLYHAAAALMGAGDLAEAEVVLQMAERFADRDEHDKLASVRRSCLETLARVEQTYGTTVKATPLPALDPVVARARQLVAVPAPAGEPLLVRPALRAEVDLLASPDKKADAVASVPEWTRVWKVAAEDDFVQVLLPDGTTRGWMKKNSLKTN